MKKELERTLRDKARSWAERVSSAHVSFSFEDMFC